MVMGSWPNGYTRAPAGMVAIARERARAPAGMVAIARERAKDYRARMPGATTNTQDEPGALYKAKRELKSGVFATLFGNPRNAAELFNAVSGGVYSAEPDAIQFNTLQNPLFAGVENDLSFFIRQLLVVLFGHQSTPSKNLALRAFNYYAAELERSLSGDPRAILGAKRVILPTPAFHVFYNGVAGYPEHKIERLSESFALPPSVFPPGLDLELNVWNVNMGKNPALMEKSPALLGYSVLVEKVREFLKRGMALTKATEEAVRYCYRSGYLVDYLREFGGRMVSDMLSMEFDLDVAKQVWREEGREEGFEEGRKEERQTLVSLVNELVGQGMTYEEAFNTACSSTIARAK